jgi:hypothetical protein
MVFGGAWPRASFELIDQTREIAPGIRPIALVSDKPTTLELKELSPAVRTPDGLVLVARTRSSPPEGVGEAHGQDARRSWPASLDSGAAPGRQAASDPGGLRRPGRFLLHHLAFQVLSRAQRLHRDRSACDGHQHAGRETGQPGERPHACLLCVVDRARMVADGRGGRSAPRAAARTEGLLLLRRQAHPGGTADP